MYKLLIGIVLLFLLFGCLTQQKEPFVQKISFEKETSYLQTEQDCLRNEYNCDDFKSPKEAQLMLEKCGKDVHRLDWDKDGVACED